MAWRDSLQPASFRGIAFKVETHDAQYGRRVVTHEYPERDKPYVEDLGRKARGFRVDGYVIGSNYQIDRDAIIAACEKRGPGTLVHPYLGTLQVVCESLTVRESKDEGGMAKVSMSFVEAGQSEYPSQRKDRLSALRTAADQVLDLAQVDFAADFLTDKLPAFVSDSAVSHISDLTDTLSDIGGTLLGVSEWTAYSRSLSSLVSDAADLLGVPSSLGERVAELISYISANAPQSKSAVYSMTGLFRFGDDRPTIPETTTTRRQQAANERAFSALVKQAACAEAARLAATTDFDTWDDAVAVQTVIADQIDTQMETAGDQQYIAMIGLRSQLVEAVPSNDDLPRRTTVRVRSVVPSLVLAHQLYGDASRADEIVAQNRIRHPGFISPAGTLQVLSDG